MMMARQKTYPSLAQARCMLRIEAGEPLAWKMLPSGEAFCSASFGSLIMDVDGKLRSWSMELGRGGRSSDELQSIFQQS